MLNPLGIVYCGFPATMAELNNYDTDCLASKVVNIYYFVLYRKSCLASGLNDMRKQTDTFETTGVISIFSMIPRNYGNCAVMKMAL